MEQYSVLMCVYEKENPKHLKTAVDSMLQQTVPPDDFVIVKDGPLPDGLEQVLFHYEQENPSLFCMVQSEQNIGLGAALNLGLEHCKNEWVARMDSDDIAKPHRMETQMTFLADHPQVTLLGAHVEEFCDDIRNITGRSTVPTESNEIYRFAKRRSPFNHPTVVYRKSEVLSFGGYCPLRRNQDVDLFGRMLFSGVTAANVDESLLYFRSGEGLAKRRRSFENTKSYIQTIRTFWKMGYASFWDYLVVAAAQTAMFLLPIKVQHFIYKTFLRK